MARFSQSSSHQVARDLAVVLVGLAVAVLPVVELAGAQAEPAKELPRLGVPPARSSG